MSKRPNISLKEGPPTRRQREFLSQALTAGSLPQPPHDELDVGRNEFLDEELVPPPSPNQPLDSAEFQTPELLIGRTAAEDSNLGQPVCSTDLVHTQLSSELSEVCVTSSNIIPITDISHSLSVADVPFIFEDPALPDTDLEPIEDNVENFFREHQIVVTHAENDVNINSLLEDDPPNCDQALPLEQELPLYAGANLTQKESLYSILSFVQSENLCGAGVEKLLNLIDLHLPQPNLSVKTSHLFFRHLCQSDFQFELVHYCSECWKVRQSMSDLCDTCVSRPNRKVDYFVTLSLESQIRKLLARPGVLESLQYKDKRFKSNASNYEDIYDGNIYKSAERSFRVGNTTISLMWYTDGISLYECSAYSLWPFFFVVNELPPQERFKRENIIMAGLWGCHKKPHPNLFLPKICSELNKLKQGIAVVAEGVENSITVDVHVVCGTCDAPAKADFLNLIGHIGYFSCPRCLIKGEKSEATGNVLVFPHDIELVPRTEASYQTDLNEVMNNDKLESSRGVKGPTILSYMLTTPVLSSTAIDGMHCVYIGVFRQLINLLFHVKFCKLPFSMHAFLNTVNERLAGIQIPHFVQRTILPVDKLAFWKASLCRNVFFYIILPVLKDVIKVEQYSNVVDLVTGVSLLNSSSVSENDIYLANAYLNRFSENFQNLYGKRNMSSNIHALRHLAEATRDLGPLYVTSCFPFEDLNGKLANLAHGTRHAGLQISKNLSIFSDLHTKIAELNDGPSKIFCESLTQKFKRLNLSVIMNKPMYVIGNRDESVTLQDILESRLNVLFGNELSSYCTFSRLFFNKMMYVASSYCKGSRVSSFVNYGEVGLNSYAEVLTFAEVFSASKPDPDVLALVKQLKVIPFSENITHMFKVVEYSDPILVLADELKCVCFKVVVNDETFISIPLNSHELE